MSKKVLRHLSEVITLAPLKKNSKFVGISESDLGRLCNDPYIVFDNHTILEIGEGIPSSQYRQVAELDGQGGIAMPGLIDAHTHPIFAGSRSNEFCMRLDGKTYQDIAAAGGGIQATIKATATATDHELKALLKQRFDTALGHGVTSMEVKSGYAATVDEELRHLRILRDVGQQHSLHTSVTCLALHAVPPGQPSALAWSEKCAKDLLPKVKKENLATAVDVFIEKGYFSITDATPFLDAAKKLGLGIRIHADEFSDARAALCAAQYQALSADHLQFASLEGINLMAASGVCALLLPGTSVYTSIPYTNGRRFVEAGCPVGLATDFNPGSCPIDNLRLILTLGALHCRLSMAEAMAAVTWIPARALRLESRKGALCAGMDSDILVMPMPTLEDFVADFGKTSPLRVVSNITN
jgi:imidazolonepropionase